MHLNDALEIVRLTDVGLYRDHNEDALASDSSVGLVVLADGMGGYNAGEVASEIAVLSISAELKEALLNHSANRVSELLDIQTGSRLIMNAVKSANDIIYNVSQTHPQCAGMGTTLVVGLFVNNKLLVGHIGDSRMYRLRSQNLTQITEDHSFLQEQIKWGLITPEEAKYSVNKNLVTRALGIDPEVELELNEYVVEVGDIYLLCSDGLTDMVDDDVIQSTLNNLSLELAKAAEVLVELANDNGGKDNISVILIKVNRPFEYKHTWYDNFFGWLK
ncbi:MAG TPA: Stp1/IreP family PP2C-type Ser/Thr phosphatase [Methylotenera sp.]|nr:Stp1/IreP family PP2C-type Ser/Thr phosphatase [Methylotenera sp.]